MRLGRRVLFQAGVVLVERAEQFGTKESFSSQPLFFRFLSSNPRLKFFVSHRLVFAPIAAHFDQNALL